MNGAQHTKEAVAQKPSPGATASQAASANGNSAALNKKRKKDGLKPIITTEGPGAPPERWRGATKRVMGPMEGKA
ncbi:serine/threonine protein kinase, CMGC [Madurella fahalii]|uniref:Serine/threonine protein kinase, CMGC n=1 Tax=Madurella fahalii TaxID=1157608 RepID=A0ABQ0G1A7_9PEZI